MKVQEIKIGVPVTFYGVITKAGEKLNPVESTITSECWDVCGSTVCEIDGIRGGIDITHLELRDV